MSRRSRASLALSLSLVVLVGVASRVEAQVVRQLTDDKTTSIGPGAMDDAGTSVFTGATADPLGTNPQHAYQIFRFDAVSGAPTQVTDAARGTTVTVSASDDGQWLAFVSPSDLTGDNHDQSAELFVMSADGSFVDQLTDDPAVNAGSVSFVAMSGDAGRIAFLANTDPLGTNPANRTELFVIDRDGSGLAQLTTTTDGSFGLISISDDGTRIAFSHDGDLTGGNADLGDEVFAMDADGTNLRQLTTTPAGFDSGSPSLSGNGVRIAFQSNGDLTSGNVSNQDEIFVIDWDGTGLAQVTSTVTIIGLAGDPASQLPSITDDGSTIFYHSNHSAIFPPVNVDGNFEIFRISSTGSGRTTLTGSLLDVGSLLPFVSGGGGRVTYYDIGTNVELRAMDGNGGGKVTLATFDLIFNAAPEVTPDGTRVVYTRSTGLFNDGEIHRVESDGSDPVQVTSLGGSTPGAPSIAADRDTIVFPFGGNPLGTNGDLSDEIFKIRADGTGLAQLTSSPSGTSSGNSRISEDGSVVVFDSDGDLTGFNADLSREVFKVAADGSGLVQLTDGPVDTQSRAPRPDAAGTWVVFETNADLDGNNLDGTWEVYRVRTDGTGLEPITSDPLADSRLPDVSASGDRIAFQSTFDPLGTNPDGNGEVFVRDVSVPATFQLTSSTEGSSGGARISGDGTWVYFASNAPFFESDPDEPSHPYRVPATGGAIERVGALAAGAAGGPIDQAGALLGGGGGGTATDTSGGSVPFSGIGDFTEANPDLLSEVWIVDRGTPPRILVGRDSPTLVSWRHESGPLRYDVIRGDVANLGDGAGTVDLGPVVCLEDDSPDADTAGFEDPLEPNPGQVLFFLYRGTQGLLDGPGSYGRSSDGREREPASGDCT